MGNSSHRANEEIPTALWYEKVSMQLCSDMQVLM